MKSRRNKRTAAKVTFRSSTFLLEFSARAVAETQQAIVVESGITVSFDSRSICLPSDALFTEGSLLGASVREIPVVRAETDARLISLAETPRRKPAVFRRALLEGKWVKIAGPGIPLVSGGTSISMAQDGA